MNRKILLFTLPILVSCHENQDAKQPPAMPPAPVTYMHPVKKKITEWDEFTGRLQASKEVRIYSQVTGYLETAEFTEGKEVKKGDVLFRIDARPFVATRDQAAAQVEQAEVVLQLANSELSRANKLVEANAISVEEFDNKSNATKAARAGLRVAQAALKKAQVDVDYCTIVAPMDGRIGIRMLDPGALVVGGPMGATALAGIVKLDPIYAYIDVDEHSVLRYHRLIREGKGAAEQANGYVPCEMALADSEGFPFKGTITFAANELDPTTGTIQLRAVFPNPRPTVGINTLQSGYFVRVRTPRGAPQEAMLVPEAAVGADQASRMVLVVGENSEVVMKHVVLGSLIDGMRVILSGLEEKDRVIINGMANAFPGMVVNPQEMKAGDVAKHGAPTVSATPAQVSVSENSTSRAAETDAKENTQAAGR